MKSLSISVNATDDFVIPKDGHCALVIEKLNISFLFPGLMSHKLTQRIFSRIQNSTRDYFDSTYHKSQTEAEYFKMIAEKQIVACYKCRTEIKIGEEYETTHKYGRGNSRKYYHTACYQSLYH